MESREELRFSASSPIMIGFQGYFIFIHITKKEEKRTRGAFSGWYVNGPPMGERWELYFENLLNTASTFISKGSAFFLLFFLSARGIIVIIAIINMHYRRRTGSLTHLTRAWKQEESICQMIWLHLFSFRARLGQCPIPIFHVGKDYGSGWCEGRSYYRLRLYGASRLNKWTSVP